MLSGSNWTGDCEPHSNTLLSYHCIYIFIVLLCRADSEIIIPKGLQEVWLEVHKNVYRHLHFQKNVDSLPILSLFPHLLASFVGSQNIYRAYEELKESEEGKTSLVLAHVHLSCLMIV